jgi:hypothetical protein
VPDATEIGLVEDVERRNCDGGTYGSDVTGMYWMICQFPLPK